MTDWQMRRRTGAHHLQSNTAQVDPQERSRLGVLGCNRMRLGRTSQGVSKTVYRRLCPVYLLLDYLRVRSVVSGERGNICEQFRIAKNRSEWIAYLMSCAGGQATQSGEFLRLGNAALN